VELTITLAGLLSWKVGIVLFVLSVLTLVGGSLPDNDSRPGVDMLRGITWSLSILWIVGRIVT
jgi:hypothetical protein